MKAAEQMAIVRKTNLLSLTWAFTSESNIKLSQIP